MSRSTQPRRRAAALAAVPWVAWAGLRLAGLERGYPLVPALAFTPHAAAGAAVCAAGAARYRAPGAALASGAAAAALAGAVLSRAGGRGSVPAGQPRLRVATVSMLRGEAGADAVVESVRERAVDVLAVTELMPAVEAELRKAGLDDVLPHSHVTHAEPGDDPAGGGGLWARLPLRPEGAAVGRYRQPVARVTVPGAADDVEVTAVHIFAPPKGPASVRHWAADLAAIPAPAPDRLRVLAGDFNATLDHAAFRAVLGRGYRDAARLAGRGLAWTWAPKSVRRPRLTLDHVLVDPRIAVAGVRVAPVRGSDHRSVVADLLLPPA